MSVSPSDVNGVTIWYQRNLHTRCRRDDKCIEDTVAEEALVDSNRFRIFKKKLFYFFFFFWLDGQKQFSITSEGLESRLDKVGVKRLNVCLGNVRAHETFPHERRQVQLYRALGEERESHHHAQKFELLELILRGCLGIGDPRVTILAVAITGIWAWQKQRHTGRLQIAAEESNRLSIWSAGILGAFVLESHSPSLFVLAKAIDVHSAELAIELHEDTAREEERVSFSL